MAKDLKKLLNLNYLDLTNQTNKVGKFDFPCLKCPAVYNIDYIALYNELQGYQKTTKTAISFYQYDKVFDGKNGLWNAIKYNDKNRLKFFIERFKDCKYFISPDYSQCADIENAENSIVATDFCEVVIIDYDKLMKLNN